MTKTTLIALLGLLLAGPARAQEDQPPRKIARPVAQAEPPELPGVPAEMTPEEKAAADAWAADALAAEEKNQQGQDKSQQGRVRRRLREAAEKARLAEEKARASSKRKARSGSAADKASRAAAAEKVRAADEAASSDEASRAAGSALSDVTAEGKEAQGSAKIDKAATEEERQRSEAAKALAAEKERARAGSEPAAKAQTADKAATAGSGVIADRPAAPVTNYVERHDASPAWARRTPLTSGQALLRSAFVPGLGQIQTGRPIRGYTFLGAAGLSLGSTIWMTARAAQANNLYESAPASVRLQAYDQARSYASTRNTLIAMTSLIWAVNVAEAYFLNGTTDR